MLVVADRSVDAETLVEVMDARRPAGARRWPLRSTRMKAPASYVRCLRCRRDLDSIRRGRGVESFEQVRTPLDAQQLKRP